MKKILQKESNILRDIATEVPTSEITSPKIARIIEEMKEALASQEDGVAIAAPQIGYGLRMFVVSGKVPNLLKKGTLEAREKMPRGADSVHINPIIKKSSKEKRTVEEGCLSVRYLYGKVSRSTKVLIESYDENGKKHQSSGVGLLAQIFQHEIDHLNGILFLDKAKYVEEILPAVRKIANKHVSRK